MTDRPDRCPNSSHWFRCWLREEVRAWGWVLLVIAAAGIFNSIF